MPFRNTVKFKYFSRSQVLFKDICGYCPRAHFLRRETEKVRLGPVSRPNMNSDRYRFLILLFQNDVLPLSRQSKVTKSVRNIYLTFQHQIQINRLGKNKRGTQYSRFNPGYKYDIGRDSD